MAKDKKKRVKKQKKPQKLPIAVQALLKYLGGTDVKVGATPQRQVAFSQPVAPIYQSQQPSGEGIRPLRQRRSTAPIVAASPLSALAPQPVIPVVQQPIPQAKPSEKIAEKEQKESQLALVRSKVGGLESSLEFVKQQSGRTAAAFQQGIIETQEMFEQKMIKYRYHQGQDPDILDSDADITPVRPLLKESGLGLQVSTEQPKLQRAISAPTRAPYKEVEAGQGAFIASQYVQNVATPELGEAKKLRGRPPMSEEAKKAAAELRKAQKELKKQQTAEALFKEGTSATQALESLTKSITEIPKKRAQLKRLNIPANLKAVLDPSSQISMMAQGGGAAAAPEQRGKSVAELLKK